MPTVLGRELITAYGKTQTLGSDGYITLATSATATFWGSVQPISTAMLERLPEGTRRSAKWVIYAEDPVALFGDLTPPAPRVTTSHGSLVVIGEVNNTGHTSGLPHAAYICAEVGDDE